MSAPGAFELASVDRMSASACRWCSRDRAAGDIIANPCVIIVVLGNKCHFYPQEGGGRPEDREYVYSERALRGLNLLESEPHSVLLAKSYKHETPPLWDNQRWEQELTARNIHQERRIANRGAAQPFLNGRISYDTLEEIACARAFVEYRRWEGRLAVVTSAWHALRTEWICREVFLTASFRKLVDNNWVAAAGDHTRTKIAKDVDGLVHSEERQDIERRVLKRQQTEAERHGGLLQWFVVRQDAFRKAYPETGSFYVREQLAARWR